MSTRKQIEVLRKVPIYTHRDDVSNIQKAELIKALSNMKDNEVVTELGEFRGFTDPGFGSMDNEQVWSNYRYLVFKSFRPETDDEFSKRMEEEVATVKRVEENELLTYLKLKAKFEPLGK